MGKLRGGRHGARCELDHDRAVESPRVARWSVDAATRHDGVRDELRCCGKFAYKMGGLRATDHTSPQERFDRRGGGVSPKNLLEPVWVKICAKRIDTCSQCFPELVAADVALDIIRIGNERMSVHLVGELSKADLAPTDGGVHHEETIASSFEDEDKVGETIGERGDDKRRKTGLSGRDGRLPWDDHLKSVEPEAVCDLLHCIDGCPVNVGAARGAQRIKSHFQTKGPASSRESRRPTVHR